MKLDHIKSVYFLGIGGIGMSAIARYFKANGASVSGYDKTPSDLTDELIQEGIEVGFSEQLNPKDLVADLYVFTPAIPKNHPAFAVIEAAGRTWYKRSQVLEWITAQKTTIAVSGTHGKTTTSAFLTHILNHCLGTISGFVGGVMTNYNSNLIAKDDSTHIVVEADEYDRSFLRLHPQTAIITSLDPDHLDIYGTFEAMKEDYKTFASSAEKLVLHHSLTSVINHPNTLTYGLSDKARFRAKMIGVENGCFVFDAFDDQIKVGQFKSKLPGRHNVENALAAIVVAHYSGCKSSDIQDAVSSFKGVHRRFERVLERGNLVLIDDYAHHPKEIEAVINAAREPYPNRQLTVIFQPHLYSRTRDLLDDFVHSLNRADQVVLLPIYPAREEPITGVSSANLLNKLTLKTKLLVEKSDLVNAVLSLSPEIVLMLGAGDIDRLVKPLANAFKSEVNVE
jgi:UDP-N-acetylmuramate--alanine ligase